MSPQLSCGDTCQIWTWCSMINQYFASSEKQNNTKKWETNETQKTGWVTPTPATSISGELMHNHIDKCAESCDSIMLFINCECVSRACGLFIVRFCVHKQRWMWIDKKKWWWRCGMLYIKCGLHIMIAFCWHLITQSVYRFYRFVTQTLSGYCRPIYRVTSVLQNLF